STNKSRRSSPTPDPDLDQLRVPQGSVFLELYCPRPYQWGGPASGYPNNGSINNSGVVQNQGGNQIPNQKPTLPPELYSYYYNTGGASGTAQQAYGQLSLGPNNYGSAVWRLAFGQLQNTITPSNSVKDLNSTSGATNRVLQNPLAMAAACAES